MGTRDVRRVLNTTTNPACSSCAGQTLEEIRDSSAPAVQESDTGSTCETSDENCRALQYQTCPRICIDNTRGGHPKVTAESEMIERSGDRPVIRLSLRKPKHWKWQLTTSRSSPAVVMPTIHLLDEEGQLLVDTAKVKRNGSERVSVNQNSSNNTSVPRKERRSWSSESEHLPLVPEGKNIRRDYSMKFVKAHNPASSIVRSVSERMEDQEIRKGEKEQNRSSASFMFPRRLNKSSSDIITSKPISKSIHKYLCNSECDESRDSVANDASRSSSNSRFTQDDNYLGLTQRRHLPEEDSRSEGGTSLRHSRSLGEKSSPEKRNGKLFYTKDWVLEECADVSRTLRTAENRRIREASTFSQDSEDCRSGHEAVQKNQHLPTVKSRSKIPQKLTNSSSHLKDSNKTNSTGKESLKTKCKLGTSNLSENEKSSSSSSNSARSCLSKPRLSKHTEGKNVNQVSRIPARYPVSSSAQSEKRKSSTPLKAPKDLTLRESSFSDRNSSMKSASVPKVCQTIPRQKHMPDECDLKSDCSSTKSSTKIRTKLPLPLCESVTSSNSNNTRKLVRARNENTPLNKDFHCGKDKKTSYSKHTKKFGSKICDPENELVNLQLKYEIIEGGNTFRRKKFENQQPGKRKSIWQNKVKQELEGMSERCTNIPAINFEDYGARKSEDHPSIKWEAELAVEDPDSEGVRVLPEDSDQDRTPANTDEEKHIGSTLDSYAGGEGTIMGKSRETPLTAFIKGKKEVNRKPLYVKKKLDQNENTFKECSSSESSNSRHLGFSRVPPSSAWRHCHSASSDTSRSKPSHKSVNKSMSLDTFDHEEPRTVVDKGVGKRRVFRRPRPAAGATTDSSTATSSPPEERKRNRKAGDRLVQLHGRPLASFADAASLLQGGPELVPLRLAHRRHDVSSPAGSPRRSRRRAREGAMGSNVSRHSGKGLSGRRTQSSGNLCNGNKILAPNVGLLAGPKFCGSLPNHLDVNSDTPAQQQHPPQEQQQQHHGSNAHALKNQRNVELRLHALDAAAMHDQGYGSERSPEEELPPRMKGWVQYPFIKPDCTFPVCLLKGSRGLGLSVTGGIDTPEQWPGLVRIKRIFPHQPAWQSGQLQQGDILLQANGIPLVGLTNYQALEVLRKTPSNVVLTVCRPPMELCCLHPPSDPPPPPPPPPRRDPAYSLLPLPPLQSEGPMGEFDIMLTKVNRSLGFTLRKEDDSALGHYVRALVREPALSDGRIRPGDKILAVNDVDISPMSHEEAVMFLRQCGDVVKLRLYRDAAQTPVSALSPTEEAKVFRPKPPLRKEAMDMLSDLAGRKLLPSESGESSGSSYSKLRRVSDGQSSSTCSSPRRRRLTKTPSPDAASEQSRLVHKYLASSQMGTSDSSEERSSLDSTRARGHASSFASTADSFEGEVRPTRPNFLDLCGGFTTPGSSRKQKFTFAAASESADGEEGWDPALGSTAGDYEDTTAGSAFYSNSSEDCGDSAPPAEPASMPPLTNLSSTSSTSTAFSYRNPAYQSANPTHLGHPTGMKKSSEDRASDQDIPGKLFTCQPGMGSRGLLKWKGVVFTPETETEEGSIDAMSAISKSFNQTAVEREQEDQVWEAISCNNELST